MLRSGRGVSVEQLIGFVHSLRSLQVLTPSLRAFIPPGLKSTRFSLYRAITVNSIMRSDALESKRKRPSSRA